MRVEGKWIWSEWRIQLIPWSKLAKCWRHEPSCTRKYDICESSMACQNMGQWLEILLDALAIWNCFIISDGLDAEPCAVILPEVKPKECFPEWSTRRKVERQECCGAVGTMHLGLKFSSIDRVVESLSPIFFIAKINFKT